MNWKLPAMLVAVLAGRGLAQDAPGAEGPAQGPLLGDGPHEIATLASVAAKRAVVPARRVELPSLDARPLLDEDTASAAMPALKADVRVGVIRTFREVRAPARLLAGGHGVETMSDGSLVWTAEVGSPGAVGLRLHVSRCDLPQGATLVAYDAGEPKEAYGPFGARGPGGTGEFFLPTVFGEAARVEIRVPPQSAGARLIFSIDRVAQRYREHGEGMEDLRIGVVAKAGSCNNNVACDAGYTSDVARAVATMEITGFDGVFLCTGALLNDSVATSKIPYLLTAHHCLSLESEAKNTEFYFDYRAGTCDGTVPSLSSVPRTSGSTLLATSASSDYTLLRLTGTLPSNRFFCGWTASRQPTSEAVVGVHHPGGGAMRISYGTLLDPDGSFHQVQWSSGVTAGGSSGSPLFNPQKQVIGQLYGGASSCADRSGVDEYGRFDRTYPSLTDYLGQGGATANDSYDPVDDTLAGAALLTPPGLFGGSHGPHTLSKTDTADWFAFDLGVGVHYRFFSTGHDDVKATLYADPLGTVVAASDDDSAGSKQFSIDFTPPSTTRYRLKVTTATAAAGAEYTLNFIQVDVRVTSAPPAVTKLRKSIDSGIVTLKWKDRARSESGYYVDISDDGVNWSRVVELPRDARTFEHDPGPGLHQYRVGAWGAAVRVHYRQISVFVVDVNQTDAADPGDDSGAGATVLSPEQGGTTAARSLSLADFADWYRITLTAGRTYSFETRGTGDTYGEIFDDATGLSQETSDDDSGEGHNFRMEFVVPRTAAYWVRVTPARDGDLINYTLRWLEK